MGHYKTKPGDSEQVSRLRISGPGAELRACDSCSEITAHGREGDSDEYRGKWFCIACWDKWETGHNEGCVARGGSDDEEAPIDGRLPHAVLVEMWLACQDALMVSLGTWCGVKKAMRGLNIGGPSLPFDWIRVSIRGVICMLRERFDSFFDYFFITHDRHFIAETHSFFHDDLMRSDTVRRYKRRIDRFWRLAERGNQTRPLSTLFVYALNSTVELLDVVELLNLLKDNFGAAASLLLLLDGQPEDLTLFFEDSSGLMLHTISTKYRRAEDYSITEPPYVTAYRAPLTAALQHVNGGPRPAPSKTLPSVSSLVRDALLGAQECPLQHISLGEDLTTSMAYEPHLPSDRAFREALLPINAERRDIMWASCKAHYQYIGAMELPENVEPSARDRLPACRWRLGFAAAMFAHKVLSMNPRNFSAQTGFPDRVDATWENID